MEKRHSKSTPQAKGQGNACFYVMMITKRIIGLSFSFQFKKMKKTNHKKSILALQTIMFLSIITIFYVLYSILVGKEVTWFLGKKMYGTPLIHKVTERLRKI